MYQSAYTHRRHTVRAKERMVEALKISKGLLIAMSLLISSNAQLAKHVQGTSCQCKALSSSRSGVWWQAQVSHPSCNLGDEGTVARLESLVLVPALPDDSVPGDLAVRIRGHRQCLAGFINTLP